MAAHSEQKEVKPGQLINADIDVIMCHDVTTPPAISMLAAKGLDKVIRPGQNRGYAGPFSTCQRYSECRAAQTAGQMVQERTKSKIYYPVGKAGVCHALLPEQGHVRPGETLIGGDSHTCTYGAFGAFSTGIGSTDLAAAIATGQLWFRIPSSIKFVLNGKLGKGVYSKDIILAVIARIGTDGARYQAMEFVGDTLKDLSMAARMTITNMAIEAGGKSGIMAVDDITKAYLAEHLKDKKDYTVYESDARRGICLGGRVRLLKTGANGGRCLHLPSGGKAISEVAGMENGPELYRQLHQRT